MAVPSLTITKELSIPRIGFGTYGLTGQVCLQAVYEALIAGYRHIDTAHKYQNHDMIAKAMKESGVKRSEIFLTSKVFHNHLRRGDVFDSCERALQELRTDYLDLFMVHWPNRNVQIEETLTAFHALKQAGKIRAIGVSNFTEHHLYEALATGVDVVNNQIEIHPSFFPQALIDWCFLHDISVTAYAPLGTGKDLYEKKVADVAYKYNITPAQVIIQWIVSKGIIAIPKSQKTEAIESNLKSMEVLIGESDLQLLDTIEQRPRLVEPIYADFGY